jgi:hypothetical protein
VLVQPMARCLVRAHSRHTGPARAHCKGKLCQSARPNRRCPWPPRVAQIAALGALQPQGRRAARRRAGAGRSAGQTCPTGRVAPGRCGSLLR